MTKPTLPTTKCPHCFALVPLPPATTASRRWLLLCTILSVVAFAIGFAARDEAAQAIARDARTASAVPDSSGKKAPVRTATASVPARTTGPRSATWNELVERSGSPPRIGSGQAVQFEKGKLYQLDMFIAQIGAEFILAGSPFPNGEPYAIITFAQSEMDNVTADKGDLAQAIGRFDGYRVVESGLGTEQRYPVFEMVGLSNRYKKSFHSFE